MHAYFNLYCNDVNTQVIRNFKILHKIDNDSHVSHCGCFLTRAL